MKNPEDHVLDAIDELVNETMAAGVDRWGNPRDDYSSNRYPGCPGCHHDWHGVACEEEFCGCTASEGELVTSTIEDRFAALIPRREIAFGIVTPPSQDQDGAALIGPLPRAPWVVDHREPPFNTAGYTLADLEELRSRSSILRDYPQRYVMGDRPAPRVRFWARIGDRLQVVEGVALMMHIEWTRDYVTLAVQLNPFEQHDLTPGQMFELDLTPAGDVPEGMITMEGFTPGGQRGSWAVVGRLNPSDLEIETNTEYIYNLEGQTVRADEQCHATIRLSRAQVDENVSEWVIE